MLPAPYFLATKFEAFACRGKNDYLMSRDVEDIVTVIDGRPEIVTEIEPVSEALKSYMVTCCFGLLKERNFLDALPGHLLPDAASQSRSVIVIDRLTAIAGS